MVKKSNLNRKIEKRGKKKQPLVPQRQPVWDRKRFDQLLDDAVLGVKPK